MNVIGVRQVGSGHWPLMACNKGKKGITCKERISNDKGNNNLTLASNKLQTLHWVW